GFVIMYRTKINCILAFVAILTGFWLTMAGVARADGPRWVGGLAVMSEPRQEVAVVALNGKVYVIGGFRASGDISTRMDVYDPWTDTWSVAASIPAEVYNIAAVAAGGKIYAVGGIPPEHNTYAYDPRTNTWEVRARMPNPRGGVGVGVIDNKIY